MACCMVIGCKAKSDANTTLQLFDIPAKPFWRRQAFITAIGRTNWVPSHFSRICELHFLDYIKSDDVNSLSYLPTRNLPFSIKLKKTKKMECVTNTDKQVSSLEKELESKENEDPDVVNLSTLDNINISSRNHDLKLPTSKHSNKSPTCDDSSDSSNYNDCDSDYVPSETSSGEQRRAAKKKKSRVRKPKKKSSHKSKKKQIRRKKIKEKKDLTAEQSVSEKEQIPRKNIQDKDAMTAEQSVSEYEQIRRKNIQDKNAMLAFLMTDFKSEFLSLTKSKQRVPKPKLAKDVPPPRIQPVRTAKTKPPPLVISSDDSSESSESSESTYISDSSDSSLNPYSPEPLEISTRKTRSSALRSLSQQLLPTDPPQETIDEHSQETIPEAIL